MSDHHDSPNQDAGLHEADMADDQLLDAILRGRAQDTEDSMNARVARVMARVATISREEPEEQLSPPIDRGFRLISFGRAVAAALLFGVLISLMLVVSRPPTAEATLLQRAIQRMGVEDLTYSITVVTSPDATPDKRPALDRAGVMNRHPESRAFAWKQERKQDAAQKGRRSSGPKFARLDGATLQTRGELWCLQIPTPHGKTFARGFDGETIWTNTARDGARSRSASPSLGEYRVKRSLEFLEFAMLDLSEMLIQLDRGYEISDPDIVESQFDESSLVRFEATRRPRSRPGGSTRAADQDNKRTREEDHRRRLPRSLEIWADPDSERIVFLRLTGLGSPGSDETVTLELALESTTSISDEVFTRGGHDELSMPRRPRDPSPGDRRRDAGGDRSRAGDQDGRPRKRLDMGQEP